MFNNIITEDLLNNEKRMFVTLLKTQLVSFDFLFNHEEYKDILKTRLREIEDEMTKYSDRIMVYFICVRKKVRFRKKENVKKCILIDIFENEQKVSKILKIPIKKIVKIMQFETCFRVDCDFDMIYFYISDKNIKSLSIHDFLEICSINTGNVSKIVYVGETDFPLHRPFDKPHLGMMRAIYNYKNRGNDLFIYYNLFHVQYIDIPNSVNKIQYRVSNSLVELLGKKEEGRFIQNAFIQKLLPPDYSVNYKNEIGELNNKIIFLKTKYKVNLYEFVYEVSSMSDFYRFSSDLIKSTNKIIFSF